MPTANMISGPYDIAVLEQMREMTYANLHGVERVPTDVFVWSRGEPVQRAMTKIGGLPYREAGRPWPVTPSGATMTFVAQICFADSQDIIPPLPGDLLLIFAEGQAWEYGELDEEDVAFEWSSLNRHPLVSPEEIPETTWDILPCYGAIHRTWDYPHVNGLAYPDIAPHIPPVFEATKIGGSCPWSNTEWSDYSSSEMEGYLCSLSSLHNAIYRPFPFLNVSETIRWEEWNQSNPLMIGDVGLMNFFLNPDETIRWRLHAT